MNKYHIVNIRHRQELQLLFLMYNENKVAYYLNQTTTNIVLCSSKKVKFKEKLTKKTTVQNSPYYSGVKLWNTLPDFIQKEQTLIKFKLN